MIIATHLAIKPILILKVSDNQSKSFYDAFSTSWTHLGCCLPQFHYSEAKPETLVQIVDSTSIRRFHANKLTFPVPTHATSPLRNLNRYIMTKRADRSYNYSVGRPAIIPSTVVINDASVLKVISMKTFPVTVQEAKTGCEWWRGRLAWQWSVCAAVPTKQRIDWSCEVISGEETGAEPLYETTASS